MTEFTDWLGQPLAVGDVVVYGAHSGRSIIMVLARVEKFKDNGTLVVLPLKSSRWRHHNERVRYVDSRTGRSLGTFPGVEHMEPETAVYRHKTTGEVRAMPGWDWAAHLTEYIPPVFKDYVQRITLPVAPVTLTVTENVTRWTGVLPDE